MLESDSFTLMDFCLSVNDSEKQTVEVDLVAEMTSVGVTTLKD